MRDIKAILAFPNAESTVLTSGSEVAVWQQGNTVHKRSVPGQIVNEVAFERPDAYFTDEMSMSQCSEKK